MNYPHRALKTAIITTVVLVVAAELITYPAQATTAAVPIRAVADFSAAGAVIPASFLGISVEYGSGTVGGAVGSLFGPQSIAATANLLNGLGTLQGAPVIRIGGASEDASQWSNATPADSSYMAQTVQDLANVANATDGKLIIGLNFKTGTPAMDELWVNQTLDVIGAQNIMGWELGNEPDFYYSSYQAYDSAWNSFAHAINTALPLTNGMLVGPAFAGQFRVDTPQFVASQHAMLSAVTIHNYAFGPSITTANLLSNSASTQYASIIQPSVMAAAAYGIPVRYGEMNSAYNGGKNGVTNTFAQSLWSLDTMFEVASTGAAGVNFHTGPLYGAFVSTGAGDQVLPLYYGMLMFAQAAPPGSQIVPVSFGSTANVKIWMTRDGNVDRIVVINKSLTQNVSIQFQLPSISTGKLEFLSAPSASSEFGITIGGLTFNGHDGRPTGIPNLIPILGDNGLYTINVNATSAALLTLSVPEIPSLILLAVCLFANAFCIRGRVRPKWHRL